MLELRRLTAAPPLVLLACTSTGEPEVAQDVPAADTNLEAATYPPRPPRPPILGATLASEQPVTDTRCDDRPAQLAVVPLHPQAPPTTVHMAVQRGGDWFGLPLRETRYDVVVVGDTAEISMIQVFHNPLAEPVTAVYGLPLPSGAAVDDCWIRLAGRELHGVMKTVADARELLARAGDAARSPWPPWPDLFSQTIPDVPAGATIEVEMRLIQPLRRESGRYGLILPATFRRQVPAIDPIVNCSPVDVQVTIEAGVPVTDLRSKHHALTVETAPDRVRLELTRGAPRPAYHDVDLSWQIAGPEPRVQLIAQHADDDRGYFTLTVEPPLTLAPDPVRPRDLVFVLDTSPSMQGPPLDTAVDAIRRALVTMGPDDTFQIVRLAAGRPSLAPAPLRNTPANVTRAVAYLTELRAEDGPESLVSVTAALARKAAAGRLRMALFVTDGSLGDATGVLAELARRHGDARLFTLGVGPGVDLRVLDSISRIGRGATVLVGTDRPWEAAERLHEQFGAPVWTDLELDWGGLAVVDVVPSALPDLFAGQPVVVHGRFTGAPTGEVTLRARRGAAAVAVPVKPDVRDAAPRAGLRSQWAHQQIDALLGYPSTTTSVPDPRTVAAVTELAIAHRVTTAYTTLVALETREEPQPDGAVRRVQVPVAPPGAATEADPPFAVDAHTYGRGGSAFGGRSTRVPTVRQARADVTGALDKDIVRRIVRAHINEVRACYNVGLERDRNIMGRVSVAFTIDARGKVTAASIKEDTVPDKIVAPCITAAVRRWRFPKPEGGGAVEVVYPFVLAPG